MNINKNKKQMIQTTSGFGDISPNTLGAEQQQEQQQETNDTDNFGFGDVSPNALEAEQQQEQEQPT